MCHIRSIAVVACSDKLVPVAVHLKKIQFEMKEMKAIKVRSGSNAVLNLK